MKLRDAIVLLILYLFCAYNELASGKMLDEKPTKRIDKQTINLVSFSPDSKLLAIAGDEGIWLYDTSDFREKGLLKGHDSDVNCAVFSPDGKTIASASWDKTIRIWNVNTRKGVILGEHNDVTFRVAFSPDGKTLAASSTDKTISLWNVPEQKRIGTFEVNNGWAYTIEFSPDGRTLASGTSEGVLQLWDVDSKTKTWEYRNSATVYYLSFSTDGKMLAWTGLGKVCIMDVESKKISDILNLIGVKALAFSPNGDFLAATASLDGTIRLWDIENQEQILALAEFDEQNWGRDYVTFSPDGKWLAYNGGTGIVLFYEVDLPAKKIAVEQKDKLPTTWGILRIELGR
jgi:WD40 repeat protein